MGVVTIHALMLFLKLKVIVTSIVYGPVTAGNGVVFVCNLVTGGTPPTSVTWT